MKFIKCAVSTLIGVFLIYPLGWSQSFNIEDLEKSIVKITAKQGGKARSATGFVWQGENQIITSLHAVVGKDTSIFVQCKGATRRASVVKVDRASDLALLETEGMSCQPLKNLNLGSLRFNQQFTTLGFLGGAKNAMSRTLTRGHVVGDEKLSEILPRAAKNSIQRAGMPSLDLDVYYLEGSLLPGFSGAPVVDDQGSLIGIGDGGLENGASQISWVIPATQISTLLNSNDQGTDITARAGELFSSEVDTPDEVVLEFVRDGKSFRFVKTKTRTLAELISTSEDPDGIIRLLETYKPVVPIGDGFQLVFDVYEDLNHGVVITVPEGQELKLFQFSDDWQNLERDKSDADGNRMAHTRYYNSSSLTGSDMTYIAADSPRFFNEIIADHLSGGLEPGYSTSTLDEEALRVLNFGGGRQVLKVGYTLFTESEPPRFLVYDYQSWSVIGKTAFKASVRLSADGLIKCRWLNEPQPCRDNPQKTLDELSEILSVHLTSFADLRSATGEPTLETEFVYNNEFEDPDVIRQQYHFGPDNQVFINSRGLMWWGFGYHPDTIVGLTQIDKDETHVYLKGVFDSFVGIPIYGGDYLKSFDEGATWEVVGEIRKHQW